MPAGRLRWVWLSYGTCSPASRGCTAVAFHEEHLPDEQARALRKAYWTQVLDDLESANR